jgi:hypothetical protein
VPVDVTTDDGTQTWLQYVMITPDGAVSVQGLPGLLPPPKSGDKPTGSAAGKGLIQVDAGSRIYTSTKDFLNAWLTGAGDISRLAEPQVPTFVNPPCDSIEKLTVTATDQPQKIEGKITVDTVINCVSATTRKLHYNFILTGASGRWVVSDITAAPAVT